VVIKNRNATNNNPIKILNLYMYLYST